MLDFSDPDIVREQEMEEEGRDAFIAELEDAGSDNQEACGE